MYTDPIGQGANWLCWFIPGWSSFTGSIDSLPSWITTTNIRTSYRAYSLHSCTYPLCNLTFPLSIFAEFRPLSFSELSPSLPDAYKRLRTCILPPFCLKRFENTNCSYLCNGRNIPELRYWWIDLETKAREVPQTKKLLLEGGYRTFRSPETPRQIPFLRTV